MNWTGAGDLESVVTGWVVWLVFGLLVVPLLIGTIHTPLMVPLALPGYLLMVALTVVGSYVIPQYAYWLYWVPFVLGSFGIAVVASASYHWIKSKY